MTSSKKIIFDLDGVLRDLVSYIEERYYKPFKEKNSLGFKNSISEDYKMDLEESNRPNKFLNWNDKIDCEGTKCNLPEAIEEDSLFALLGAKPTEYLTKEIISYINEIWTHQPEHWIYYTQKWIDEHITPLKGSYPVIRFLTPIQKVQMIKEKDAILIEDNPTLPVMDNIILVERPYNKHSNHKKVRTEKELLELISKYK